MNNITVQSFFEDVKNAEQSEQEVLRVVQTKYPLAFKVDGNFKYYDIEVPGITTIEVKHDKRSEDTDNFFVECEFNGEPSGIEATQAIWWVFVDKLGYYFIRTDSLKYLLREKHCFLRSIQGPDGTKINYRLIKKDIIGASPYSTFIKRLILL